MAQNEQYWIDRANRRMDGYQISAIKQARIINRSYSQTCSYVQSEIAKILRHIGDEDSLAYEYRMRRLNALLANTRKMMQELYGITLNDTTEFLRNIIPEAYYHTIFDVAQGAGEQPVFSAVNTRLIDKIVNDQWSGKNYSQRIWWNTSKLSEDVQQLLTTAAMSGESIYKTSRRLSERFGESMNNSVRLIRTETTYACNQAEMASYKSLDIDRYKFVATLDTRTSTICQKLDGKVFETKGAQAGKNLPSMHPNCRSTTIPYFEDGMPEIRAARDKDGNRIKVPADMTYPEWYEKYIKPSEGSNGSQKPQKTLDSKPAEINIPAPDNGQPEYTDTPIPKNVHNSSVDNSGESGIIESKKKSNFVPAKTKQEAVEYAHKFAVNVDYDKLSLENANIINETLDELTAKYPTKKLETIKPGKGGAMSGKHNQLTYNKQYLGETLKNEQAVFLQKQEAAKRSIEEIKERYKTKAKMPFSAELEIKKHEEVLKYKRHGVHSSYEQHLKVVTTHEYGHIIADQYFGQMNKDRANINYLTNWRLEGVSRKWEQAFEKAKTTGDIYNLSQYSSKSVYEFFAESFAAREMGEKLPDYVEELMKEVLDNGIM